MRITFESVSYSYTDPKHKEKQRRSRRRLFKKTPEETPDSLKSHDKADWGNDPDATWTLSDISFTLEEGEFLGLAGHTGSGKSTLTQLANGLIQPTFGTVFVDGHDLADKEEAAAVRGKVGLVFQYPENQLFAPTVAEDVAFGPRNLGVPAEDLDARVDKALREVHLNPAEIRDKSPFELSGGQQRRVAFAGILAMEPEILILDEPIAGLDPLAKEEFLSLIAELNHQGMSIIMVSHNMDDLARLADRLMVLNNGRIFALDTPASVFNHGDELRAIGLDVPQAQKLALELREEGFCLPRELYSPQTLAEDLIPQLTATHTPGAPAPVSASIPTTTPAPAPAPVPAQGVSTPGTSPQSEVPYA